jgi:hypothetical protein
MWVACGMGERVKDSVARFEPVERMVASDHRSPRRLGLGTNALHVVDAIKALRRLPITGESFLIRVAVISG